MSTKVPDRKAEKMFINKYLYFLLKIVADPHSVRYIILCPVNSKGKKLTAFSIYTRNAVLHIKSINYIRILEPINFNEKFFTSVFGEIMSFHFLYNSHFEYNLRCLIDFCLFYLCLLNFNYPQNFNFSITYGNLSTSMLDDTKFRMRLSSVESGLQAFSCHPGCNSEASNSTNR